MELWIEAIQEYGNQVWIGLCIIVLTLGFAFCAGNLRRQILIGVLILLWGSTLTFYEEFYVMPIATYTWFPYWVLLETLLLLAAVNARQLSLVVSKKLNISVKKITTAELRQESIICVLCLASIFTDIAQLGSALSGFGRITAEYYDHANRLLFSLLVVALVTPGQSGLIALRDAFNEKVIGLVAGRSNRNRSVDNS